jgi:MinD-like ATPase involved in chromosome partitioning or flagellar assembly
VHESFKGVDQATRHALISGLIQDVGLRPVILELCTIEEAKERGISLAPAPNDTPASWDEALTIADAGESPSAAMSNRRMRRVVFYSYKGGVGRTTALVHTAFHLARRGKRVVIVDMDVEAPGIHKVLPPGQDKKVTLGLVDYLWERQVRPVSDDVSGPEVCLVGGASGASHQISYTVEDPTSRAQVHVIPAGAATAQYVRRLGSLSYEEVLTRADDAWTLFEKDLVDQFDPDVMLIDSRTGLGEWGGLSLLRLADDVFLVLFPSDQNEEGISFVKSMLEKVRGISPNLVLSPIPEGPVGKELVSRFSNKHSIDGDANVSEIFYSPGIASASVLPVESAMFAYEELANLISDIEKEGQVEASLQKANRTEIIRSLTFPERDAKTIVASHFETFFQKTSDFDKFLDDARWVVRGRKGTGKSTLFHLFVEHRDNAIKRARGKLEGVDIIPGHGPTPGAQFRPTTDEFLSINRVIESEGLDWLSFWRAYAIIRLWTSDYGPLRRKLGDGGDLSQIYAFLRAEFPKGMEQPWRHKHTQACLELIRSPLVGQCRDLYGDINRALAHEGKKVWLLYDDLDQDIRENATWQGEALGGLLRLAYDSNNQDLHNIRLKIFLREDIWSKLVFTNKSHFGEPRTVLLQWRIEDFLRLAYRLATGGSAPLRALIEREVPLADADVDTASEVVLQQALAPLWGLSQEKGKKALAAKWVYSRMSDARDNTYPRSLTVLLSAARDEELRVSSKSPPPDRLLSPRAMQAGLKSASIERVNALKNEYPQLKPFLEDIEKNSSLRSQFLTGELFQAWDKTSRSEFETFDSFVLQLEESGLMTRKRSATYDYGFASLYIDGLGVTRVQGEKK